jgi:tetratricopeptide (TPR) repeat protein
MLFDLRGKRKRVIQVIYVLLAIIMAASLLVIGLPGGINPFSQTQNNDLAQISIDRAERLEQRAAEEPNNANIKAELIRARVAAGGSLVEVDEQGRTIVGDQATVQYDLAAQAWEDYLKATDNNPDPTVAVLVANTLFSLAQGATVAQFEANIKDAAKAQQFVVDSATEAYRKGEGPPPTGALVTLASYQFYAQQTEAAEKNRKKALALTKEDAEREQIAVQLNQVREEGERVGRLIDRARRQARQDGGASLQDPLGSLGTPDAQGAAPSQP